MQISDFKFQISNFRFGPLVPGPWSLAPVLNPEPRTLNPRLRRGGVTIVEVLFSILVTAVGLLGAIAIFPVASAQANRAKRNDAAATSGRSAVHTFDTMGMRQNARWVGFSTLWDTANPQLSPPNFYPIQNIRFPPGTSFCIDPRMIAKNGVGNAQATSIFPYYQTWTVITPFQQREPRMFRISLASGSPVPAFQVMTVLHAESVFTFGDDLAFLRPGLDDVSQLNITGITNDRSLPPFQNMARSPNQRPTNGRMSWMATLVPKVDIYSGQVSDEYILSIVVFADRPADLTVGDPLNERIADAFFADDGSTGGEVLLHTAPNVPAAALKLRANDWILISGNQLFRNPNGSIANVVPRFQWYRVTHCDSEPEFRRTAPFTQDGFELYATLIGPDWNTSCVNPHVNNAMNFPQTLFGTAEATIVQGVVAVYEKTIRLDYGSTF